MRSIVQNGTYVACAVGHKVFVFVLTMDVESFDLLIPEENAAIVALAIDDHHFIFAAFSNKKVVCWNCREKMLTATTIMKKVPTAIGCAAYHHDLTTFKYLLIADKAGDLWAGDSPNLKKQVIFAGHTASVITDMIIFEDLVITCDRDEKIRVSALPDLTRIESYCMGHKNVVVAVAFATVPGGQSYLVSVSWDGTLMLWNHKDGSAIRRIACQSVDDPDVNIYNHKSTAATVNCDYFDTVSALKEPHEQQEDDHDAMELPPDAIEDVDEIPEKTYTQPKDSRYPIKVATSPSGLFIAVIFNNSKMLKVYSTTSLLVLDEGGQVAATNFALQSEAYDIVFIDPDELIVVEDEPTYVQCLRLSFSSKTAEDIAVLTIIEVLEHRFSLSFRAFCNLEGASFSPQIVLTQEHAHERGIATIDKGIKKHCLDKPFDPLILSMDKKSGKNHRSRKRHNEDVNVPHDL